MRSTTVEDQAVSVVVSALGPSAGRPVLVLHGFTGSAETMHVLAQPIAQTKFVLAPDLIGHGRSDAPATVDSYRAESLVGQLTAVAGMADGPIDVVGYSMGARAALTLAVACPQVVRRLVLISGTAGIEAPEERALRRTSDEALAEALLRDGVEAFADRWEALPLWETLRNRPDAVASTARRVRRRQRAIGLANSLLGFGAGVMPSLWLDLVDITAPTLLVVGGHDSKYCEIASAMAGELSNAAVEVVPDAGHAVHLEAPEAVVACCLAHLDG